MPESSPPGHWPETLPPDPALPEEHPLTARLLAVLAELNRKKTAWLPEVQGVTGLVLARWLHRGALASRPSWAPFATVDGGALGADRLARRDALETALAQSRGGTLHVSGALEEDLRVLEGAGEDVDLMVDERGSAISCPSDIAARWRALDEVHAIDMDPDPTLAALRRGLRAVVASSAHEPRPVLHLSGPVGSGRAELAAWAHRQVSATAALARLGEGEEESPSGSWLARDVDFLQQGARLALASALGGTVAPLPSGGPCARPDDERSVRAFAPIVGESPALARCLRDARNHATDRTVNVLIQGMSGVGKELLARAIHTLASGDDKPFVCFDYASRHEALVKSELFGHTKGAYTGAGKSFGGGALDATGGTLFLDEIGNLGLADQASLLRLIDTKEVIPLGKTAPMRVDMHVVAATNADLEAMVRRGLFREDLYWRLNGVTLRVPALCERPEDIPALVRSELQRARAGEEWQVSGEALEILQVNPWRGNVRALLSAVRRAVQRAEGAGSARLIGPEHLDEDLRGGPPTGFVTTSQPEELLRGPDAPMLTRALGFRLNVPPFRRRARASRVHTVRHLSAGRVLSDELLERLADAPWWHGDVSALAAAMRLLHGAPKGLIGVEQLTHQSGLLAPSECDQPLIILTHASVDAERKTLVGQRRDVDAGAVLLGRGGSPWVHPPTSDLARERMRWVSQLLGGRRGAFVALDDFSALSRAHVLIMRSSEGLRLAQVPNAKGVVEVRAAADPAWIRLSEDPLALNSPGVALRFIAEGARTPFLILHVFQGTSGLDAVGLDLVSDVRRAAPTVTAGGAPARLAAPTPSPPSPPTRWALSPEEREALVEQQIDCARSGLKRAAYYRLWWHHHRGREELTRLVALLTDHRREERIADYTHRIFSDWGDELLLKALRAALRRQPDGAALGRRLAVSVRRALEGVSDDGG